MKVYDELNTKVFHAGGAIMQTQIEALNTILMGTHFWY